MKTYTYGAELEFGDIDRRSKKLPEGCGWDERDYTMVNSNGIAVDPKGKLYPFGGEINTRPTKTIAEQVRQFEELLALFPEAAVNYRSNLHIHIGVPGLGDDLKALKRLQEYITFQLCPHINFLEPIPVISRLDYPDPEEYEGAVARYRRRQRSHHTFIPATRVMEQLAATSVKEFLELEVPVSQTGQVMWHAQCRAAVNIRQLRETKTIEFRHFPGTLDAEEFRHALVWCAEFMHAALETEETVPELLSRLEPKLPSFQPYVHWMEMRYKATTHDGTVKPNDISENLRYIIEQDGKVEPW